MIRPVIVLAALGLAAPAAAAPRKVLVLPVDGTADAATRAKLTAQVVRLARSLDGQVTTGDTTFADTALAVGCDPQAASCRDEVIASLSVDELVWGTASRDGAQIRIVVRRAQRGTAMRERSTAVAAGEAADRIEAGVAPLFAPPAAEVTPVTPAPPPVAAPAPSPVSPRPLAAPEHHHDRNIGIALTATGGVALGLGLALWASYASQQRTIDGHPTANRNDVDDLVALEDRAARYAFGGDVLVAAGVVAAGLGAYFLLRRHDGHDVALVPAPVARGAGLTLTIVGGL